MSRRLLFRLLLTFIFAANVYAKEADVIKAPENLAQSIVLPEGFKLDVFANLSQYNQLGANHQPRMMIFDAAGNLYVSITNQDKVIMFEKNKEQPTVAGQLVVVAEGLNGPHGLALVADKLYVANENNIIALEKNEGIWPAKPAQIIVENLPVGGHPLKSLKLGPDGLLYVNVGSSCNVCVETDPLRAKILRYTTQGQPAGADEKSPIYATGLRNSQGFAWHPKTKAMFATNEGADNRTFIKNGAADDGLPPEHLNHIKAGRNYGWPHCWGNINTDRVDQQDQKSNPHRWGMLFEDPNFKGEAGFCEKATPPAMVFESHSTPIGITFLHKSQFPSAYKNDAIVALHGSWNRQNPSGYKLVRIKFKGDKPIAVEDFATGWLKEKAAFGRPVDAQVGPDGALYVSDDRAGLIYRISFTR